MDGAVTATMLVVSGSAIFLVGAAIGVPRVFTERDPATKLRMLEERLTWWRAAQPLYAGGPLVAAAGTGFLAGSVDAGPERAWFGLSCLLLVVGAACWSRSVYLRFHHVREFAFGELPGWPFAAYVWLTLAGLAVLGIALLVAGFPAWTGGLTLTATLVFLLGYVRFGDIPPFVFYLLLLVVSIGWL
jgi:hypothetical protein